MGKECATDLLYAAAGFLMDTQLLDSFAILIVTMAVGYGGMDMGQHMAQVIPESQEEEQDRAVEEFPMDEEVVLEEPKTPRERGSNGDWLLVWMIYGIYVGLWIGFAIGYPLSSSAAYWWNVYLSILLAPFGTAID